ncbi:hypothetical protein FKP32DRAFT_1558776 [Trametes sanguinea]|nr:hypothetical protein FKP32DRAFT_1558776 [Trametes sanguinea]
MPCLPNILADFKPCRSILREPLPPSIATLLEQRDRIEILYPTSLARRWRVSRRIYPLSTRDSASACFYRIYQFLISDCNYPLRNELEYFCTFHPEWAVADLPDPEDKDDPARYAALAAVTHVLCEAFNRRIELGLPRGTPPIVVDWDELATWPRIPERVPAWAERVPPLQEVLRIPDGEGRYVEDGDEDVFQPFRKYNILMRQAHIHFI